MSFTKNGRKLLLLVVMLVAFATLFACGKKEDPKLTARLAAEKDVQSALSKIVWDETDRQGITAAITLVSGNKQYPNVKITWTSDQEDVVTSSGAVTRPSDADERVVEDNEGRKVVKVVLTAHVSATYTYVVNGETLTDTTDELTKDFEITILAISANIKTGTIAEVKAAAWKYIYEEKGVAKSLTSDSSTTISVQVTGIVTGKLQANGATKGYMIHDGSEGIYVYDSNENLNVGDCVNVIGDIYSYYGSLQIGSNITTEVVANTSNITIGEYKTVTPTEWEAEVAPVDGVFKDSVIGYFGGKLLIVEGTLVKKAASAGSGLYCIQDPKTGEEAWIYYKSYTEEMAATLDSFVDKYVAIKGVSYDRDSRIVKNEILWTGEIEEKSAPVVTDAEQVATTLKNIVLNEEYVEDFELSADGVWEIVSGTGIEIVDGVAKVTQGDQEQTVVLKVTVTIGEATDSKEFTVKIPASKITVITIAEAIALCGTEKNVYTEEKYSVMGEIVNIANTNYGNLTIKDATGELYIYGVYGANGDKYSALEYKPQVGDVICLTGVLGYYSSAQMKNGTLRGVQYASNYELTSIPAAQALIPEADNVTTEKYYIAGYITEVANTKYGNAYIKDILGNEFYLYGIYDATGKVRYDAMTENKPEVGDFVVVCGTLKNYKGTQQVVNGALFQLNTLDLGAMLDPFYSIVVPETATADFELDSKATWTVKSGTAIVIDGNNAVVTRGDADETVVLVATIGEESREYPVLVPKKPVEVPAGAVCATFTFGENAAEEAHKDGSDTGTTYTEENNGYTLSLTECLKVFKGGNDAKANSVLKLGTSSAVGTFTFTVPEDVAQVIFYVAGYKDRVTADNASKFTVNGTEYTCAKPSDGGEYEAFVIDTSTTKTITFATVSGACRVMIDKIEWKKAA